MRKLILALFVLFLFPLVANAEVYSSSICQVEFTVPNAWGSVKNGQ